jgi:thiamine pyrophosphokinase
MAKPVRAIIFLHGAATRRSRLQTYLEDSPLLIGCDGGTEQITRLGLVPDVVLGDFDSYPDNGQQQIAGTTYIRHPADKDYTDGELAIRYAKEAGAQEIILAGALGGRLDHLLGHVLLLNKREFAGLQVKIVDNQQEAYIIRGKARVHGKKGALISFLPFAGPVSVARSSGLVYDLSHYRISPQHNLGISNVMLGSTAEIVITRGALLVVCQLQES